MKRLTTIIAAAAMLLSLTGCEAIIDAVTTQPIFLVYTPLYDGQNFRIIRESTCKYAWSDYDTDYIQLQLQDEEAWIRVTLPDGATGAVEKEITARNPEKAEVEPVTKKFTIAPWKLVIYEKTGTDDKGNDTWEELKDNDLAGVGGKTLSVSMVARKEVGSDKWSSVGSISESIKTTAALKWEIDEEDKKYLSDFQEHETYVTFTVPGIIDKIQFKASLNDVVRVVTLIDSTF